jgi:hypothetical protein
VGHRDIAEFARVSHQATPSAWSVLAHRELKMHTPVFRPKTRKASPNNRRRRPIAHTRKQSSVRTKSNLRERSVAVQLLMKYRRTLMSLLIHPAGLATLLFFVVMILRAWRLYRS